MVAIGKLNVQIGVDLAKFRNDMNQAFKTLNSTTVQMKGSLNGLSSEFRKLNDSVGILTKGLAGLAIANVAKDLIYAADAFNQLQGKIKNSLDSATQFDDVFKKLMASSNRTGSSIEGVAQAFVRLRPVAQDLGATNDQLIQFNETFAKMGTLAGATAEEVKYTMVQLSQGLASGALRGDELRSVLEQMPQVARTIADSMGIPFSKLKDAAKDGQVTADKVFKAILDQTDEVDKQFQQLPGSIERSMNRVRNSLTQTVGNINQATDATNTFSEALDGLADFLDKSQNAIKGTIKFIQQMAETAIQMGSLVVNGVMTIVNGVILGITKAVGFALQGLENLVNSGIGMVNQITRAVSQTTRWNLPFIEQNFRSPGHNVADAAGVQAWRNTQFFGGNTAGTWSDLMSGKSAFNMSKYTGPLVLGNRPGTGKSSGGGESDDKKGKRKGKSDAEKEWERLQNEAKSLTENMRTIWEVERDEIAKADKLLKMHLITMETYQRVVNQAKNDTMKAFRIEGLDEAIKTFMEPHKKFVEDFKTDLGDALSDPAFQQQMRVQEFTDDMARQVEETRRLTQAKLQGTDAYEQMVRQIQAENDVRSLGIDLMSDEGRLLADLSLQSLTLEDNFDKLQERMQNFGQIGQQVAGIISNGLEEMIFRGEKFSDVLKDMAMNLAKMIFQDTVSKPLSGFLGSVFGKIGSSLLGSIPGFAEGGNPPVGRLSLVGENGPELIMPRSPMSVIPNHALGGSNVTLHQYFTIQTIDNRDFENRLAEHAKFIGNVSVQAIQRQENRMGRRGPMDQSRG